MMKYHLNYYIYKKEKMKRKSFDTPFLYNLERENINIHQTSEDIINKSAELINENNLEDINILIDISSPGSSPTDSFDYFPEKISLLRTEILKKEKIGILYCLLAHFIFTINNIYLKFLTQYFGKKFKIKQFLFSRGLMTVLISYCLCHYQEGNIIKIIDIPVNILKILFVRMNLNFFLQQCGWNQYVIYEFPLVK